MIKKKKDLGLLPSSDETRQVEIPVVQEEASTALSFREGQHLRHLGDSSINSQERLRELLNRLEKVRHGMSLRPAEFGSMGRVKHQPKHRRNPEVVSESVTGGVGIPPTCVNIPPEVVKPREDTPSEPISAKKSKISVSLKPKSTPILVKEKEPSNSAVFPVSSPSLLSTPIDLPNPRSTLVRMKVPSTKLDLPPRQAPIRVREGFVGVHREGSVRRLNEELKRGGKRKVFSMILEKEKKEKVIEKSVSSTAPSVSLSFKKNNTTDTKKDDNSNAFSNSKENIPLSSLEEKKNDTPTLTPAFSFGTKDSSTVDTKKDATVTPAFSFETKNNISSTEVKKDTPETPVFSFGVKKDTSITDTKKDTPNTDIKKDTPMVSGFSFGVKKDTSITDIKKDTPMAPAFSFGVKKDTSETPAFSFGVKKDTPINDTKKDTSETPAFSFGVKKDTPETPSVPSSSFSLEGKKDDSNPKNDTLIPSFSFGAKSDITTKKKDSIPPPVTPLDSFETNNSSSNTKKDTPTAPFSFGVKDISPPSFGIKKDIQPAPIFSFDIKKDTPVSNSKDTLAVSVSTSTSIPAVASMDTKKDTQLPTGFSFGTKKDDTSTSISPSFSFGVKKDPSPTPAVSSVSLEAKKDTSTAPMFSFGTKKDDTSTSIPPSFSFGAKKDNQLPGTSAIPNPSSLSIGSNINVPGTKKSTPASAGDSIFSFAKTNDMPPAQTTSTNPFTFGVKENSTILNTKKDTSISPMFSFGDKNNSSISTPPPSSFSLGVQKSNPKASMFSFGAMNDTPTPPSSLFNTKSNTAPPPFNAKNDSTPFTFGAMNSNSSYINPQQNPFVGFNSNESKRGTMGNNDPMNSIQRNLNTQVNMPGGGFNAGKH